MSADRIEQSGGTHLLASETIPQGTAHPQAGHLGDKPSTGAAVFACDGDHLLRCLRAGQAWLERHVAQVNALNVFPVPDGDTGTNMFLTMKAAVGEAGERSYPSVSELAKVVAHGALMGARGNSGVILSQIMRGFARALDNKETLTATDLAKALQEGAATAYKGVMRPVEGTILTVAREAAQAAGLAASSGGDLLQVLASACAEARASLARTPSLLPVLAEAGVVDAGGQGLVFILEGILRHVRGEELTTVAEMEAVVEHAQAPEGRYNYDTQFIILGHDLDLEAIRAQLDQMGDSVLAVGDSETVKVHLHTDAPGKALDYGVSLGQVTSVIIENMQLQYKEFKAQRSGPVATAAEQTRPTLNQHPAKMGEIGIIAVVSGEGLRRVFESLGVSAIVPGGQTMNPSTQDWLTAIQGVPAEKVILLPNNRNIILTAQQARDLAHKEVVVVPTITIPQGIAALLAFNYQADLQANAEAMAEASQQVQTFEITCAVRSVQVNGLSISEGQYIGLLNDNLVSTGDDVYSVVEALWERLDLEDYELLTIYYGQDISPGEAQELAERIRQRFPDLEVEVLDGGQPHYHYIISVE